MMLTNVVPRIAPCWLRGLGAKPCAQSDVNWARSRQLLILIRRKSTKIQCPTYHDIEEFLQNGVDNIDAIIIAAPDIYHFDMAMRALDAGLDLFVEKPLTMDLPQAKILCERAKQQNKILMVGHLLRYHTGFDCLLKQRKQA